MQNCSCCFIVLGVCSLFLTPFMGEHYLFIVGAIIFLFLVCYLSNRIRQIEAQHGLDLIKIKNRLDELEKPPEDQSESQSKD